MNRRQSYWLLFPMLVAWASDLSITLMGQSEKFWSGDYSDVCEGTLVKPVLEAGPLPFVVIQTAYIGIIGVLVVLFRPWYGRRLAVFITLIHSWCLTTWMVYTWVDKYSLPHEVFIWPWTLFISALLIWAIEKSIRSETGLTEMSRTADESHQYSASI